MNQTTGKLIKEYRMKRGLTQQYVSKRLGLKSAQYISNIERGICGLTLSRARKVATLLEIPRMKMRSAYTFERLSEIEKFI